MGQPGGFICSSIHILERTVLKLIFNHDGAISGLCQINFAAVVPFGWPEAIFKLIREGKFDCSTVNDSFLDLCLDPFQIPVRDE